MDEVIRKGSLALPLFLFLGMVQAPSLSVSPSSVELGEVQRGSTQEFSLYITPRDTGGTVEVTPRVEGPFTSTLFNSTEIEPNKVSQESIKPWISFGKDSLAVSSSNTRTFQTETGQIKAAGKIPVKVRIPDNAEPGVHSARIGFGVQRTGDSSSFSTSNWVLPYINIRMEVPGRVERSVELQDARAIRIGQNQAQIIAMLENTGTVTTEVEGGTINILNSEGEKVGELNLERATLTPNGEDRFQEVSMTWQKGNLEAGTYQLDGTGSFTTGKFYLGDQISIQQAIQDKVEVEDPNNVNQDSPGSGLPTWLVVMILMLLGVIMYSFDIDPLWIVLIIGVIGISAFVLMTGLPLYLIAITLIVGVLMIYYGLI